MGLLVLAVSGSVNLCRSVLQGEVAAGYGWCCPLKRFSLFWAMFFVMWFLAVVLYFMYSRLWLCDDLCNVDFPCDLQCCEKQIPPVTIKSH